LAVLIWNNVASTNQRSMTFSMLIGPPRGLLPLADRT
jgi:hypothetical protein